MLLLRLSLVLLLAALRPPPGPRLRPQRSLQLQELRPPPWRRFALSAAGEEGDGSGGDGEAVVDLDAMDADVEEVVLDASEVGGGAVLNWPVTADGVNFGFNMGSTLAYFFLKDELGLGEEDMLRIMMTCDTVLSLKVEENLRPKVELLKRELKFDDAAVARCVGRAPAVLSRSMDTLKAMLDWLHQRLGLKRSDRAKVVNMFPSTLTYGREGLDEKMAFYEKELGLDGKAFGRMVVTHPALLGLNVEDNVASKIAFFEDDLYLSREEMRVLVRRNPRILSASLEQKLEPSCTAIMEALDMDPVDVARMVLKAPGILLLDTERKLEPFWDWLGGAERDGGLGCTMAEVRAITRRCPSLCSRSLDALRERAAAIKSYLGVGAPALRIIVSRFPQVLSMDATTRLAELGACLERKIGMGQRQELAALVCTQPSLLGFKVESLEGKLDALLRGAAAAAASASGKDPTSRVRELVAKRPLILGLGLDRLESRMALLNAHGRDFETLGSFAMLTEARFRDWEAKRAAEAAAPDPGLE